MKTPLLLDTCALIWIGNEEPMANEALDAISEATAAGSHVRVSPISAWEIGLLSSKGRISFPINPSNWFERVMQAPGLVLAELTPEVLIASSHLPGAFHSDPADRIIVATAREFGYRLVTRDRLLLAYAARGHCAALAC